MDTAEPLLSGRTDDVPFPCLARSDDSTPEHEEADSGRRAEPPGDNESATTADEEEDCGLEPVVTEAEVATLLTKLDYTQRRLAGATSMRCALRGIACSDCAALGCCLRESGAFGRLKALDLSNNAIGPRGVRYLATALAAVGAPFLELLSLSDNPLGDDGVCALALLLQPSAHCASPEEAGRAATHRPGERFVYLSIYKHVHMLHGSDVKITTDRQGPLFFWGRRSGRICSASTTSRQPL